MNGHQRGERRLGEQKGRVGDPDHFAFAVGQHTVSHQHAPAADFRGKVADLEHPPRRGTYRRVIAQRSPMKLRHRLIALPGDARDGLRRTGFPEYGFKHLAEFTQKKLRYV